MKILKILLVAIVFLVSYTTAGATVVYDNFTNDFDNNWSITSDIVYRSADDFMFLNSTWVDGVRFWGGYRDTPPVVDDFTFVFYGDDGSGLPNVNSIITTIDVGDIGRVSTGIKDVFRNDVYLYEVSFPSILFDASETYWLSIINDVPGVSVWWGDQFIGNKASSNDFGSTWYHDPNRSHMQFQLLKIYEPATMPLLLMGLVGLAGALTRCKLNNSYKTTL